MFIRDTVLRQGPSRPISIGLVCGLLISLILLAPFATAETGILEFTDFGTHSVRDPGEFEKTFQSNSAPEGAVVTNVHFSFLIDDTGEFFTFFLASDYQVYLGSETSGSKADLIYDRSSDSILDLSRSGNSSAFNGEPADQTWYFTFVDVSSGFEGQVERIELDISWETTPVVSVSPPFINRMTTEGETPTSEGFAVHNSGTGTLSYFISVSDSTPWLSVSPSTGSSTGETNIHVISYSTFALPPGNHSAAIAISSDDAANSPQLILVTVTVEAAFEPGDINCSGDVTPGDAQEAFDYFLGISTPDCVENGDVCPPGGDLFVTPGDAQGIFNMFLGLPTPCE